MLFIWKFFDSLIKYPSNLEISIIYSSLFGHFSQISAHLKPYKHWLLLGIFRCVYSIRFGYLILLGRKFSNTYFYLLFSYIFYFDFYWLYLLLRCLINNDIIECEISIFYIGREKINDYWTLATSRLIFVWIIKMLISECTSFYIRHGHINQNKHCVPLYMAFRPRFIYTLGI